MVIGSQDTHGYTIGKWIALFSGSPAVMITIQAPRDHELTHKQAMVALESVKCGAEATLEQKVAAFPFTVPADSPQAVLDAVDAMTASVQFRE